MKTFKRKTFYTAVLAALGAMGAVGSASAVNVNPDGLGQALIYPYFTVRSSATPIAAGNNNTYLSVTNTTSSAKAVKVRFLEGKGSKEVLDFNLFLSAGDVWTGAVVPVSATDATQGAKVITSDASCTYGKVTAAGIPFSNIAYLGDGADQTLDRTNEGYVEMLEMGVITNTALLAAITHVNGVAPCTASVLTTADNAGLVGYLSAAQGGLFGGASLVNPATGVDYTYEAVALDGWDATVGGNPSASTSTFPTIANGSSLTSRVFANGTVKTANWLSGRDAVSATIMHDSVMNEYVLDTTTQSGTDWVVTFPTKRFYVTGATALARQPFTNVFGATGSCDNVSVGAVNLNTGPMNREEQIVPGVSGGFSPAVPGVTPQLCWEANVVTFNASPATKSVILGSTNVRNIATSFQNGWMALDFVAPNNVLTPLSSTTNGVADTVTQSYYGLPVVGFMVQDFVNSTLVTGTGATPGAAFGGNFAHKYTRAIQ